MVPWVKPAPAIKPAKAAGMRLSFRLLLVLLSLTRDAASSVVGLGPVAPAAVFGGVRVTMAPYTVNPIRLARILAVVHHGKYVSWAPVVRTATWGTNQVVVATAVLIKVPTAAQLRRLHRGSPQMPCPDVQPLPTWVPRPTKKPLRA